MNSDQDINTKLIGLLKEHDVYINKKNKVCLDDLVDNVIKSKHPELYMKKINNKVTIGDKYYVTLDECHSILKHGKSKICKSILEGLEKDENDDRSIISIDDNIFQYEGNKFTCIYVQNDLEEWDVWLKAVEVAQLLEYKNTNDAILKHVDDENKISFKKLLVLLGTRDLLLPKNLDKKTIFINISGFFNLIHNSKQKLAKQIKKWIDGEVLPSLIKYGSYSMQPKSINITSFYDTKAISEFYQKAVVYIGYVGLVKNEHTFKYGLSRKMFERDHTQHSKQFNKFTVVLILETDNAEQIEKLFENDLKAYSLHRTHIINKKPQTELFTVSIKHSIESLIEHMKLLVANYKLPALHIADVKQKELNDKIEHLSQSLSSRDIVDQIRLLEAQFKLSDNYKATLDHDIILKKLDFEHDIQIKNIDLKIEYLKTQRTAIKNKYTLESSDIKLLPAPTTISILSDNKGNESISDDEINTVSSTRKRKSNSVVSPQPIRN